MTILFGLIALSTVFVHVVEGWSWLDSLYFSIVSVTTVGYGDLVPREDATKVFLVLYLPIGIGVGFVVLTTAVRQMLESQRRRLTRVHEALPAHEHR
ncbi:MAG: potassium channel family protein [Thermoplasmata archaeon]